MSECECPRHSHTAGEGLMTQRPILSLKPLIVVVADSEVKDVLSSDRLAMAGKHNTYSHRCRAGQHQEEGKRSQKIN